MATLPELQRRELASLYINPAIDTLKKIENDPDAPALLLHLTAAGIAGANASAKLNNLCDSLKEYNSKTIKLLAATVYRNITEWSSSELEEIKPTDLDLETSTLVKVPDELPMDQVSILRDITKARDDNDYTEGLLLSLLKYMSKFPRGIVAHKLPDESSVVSISPSRTRYIGTDEYAVRKDFFDPETQKIYQKNRGQLELLHKAERNLAAAFQSIEHKGHESAKTKKAAIEAKFNDLHDYSIKLINSLGLTTPEKEALLENRKDPKKHAEMLKINEFEAESLLFTRMFNKFYGYCLDNPQKTLIDSDIAKANWLRDVREKNEISIPETAKHTKSDPGIELEKNTRLPKIPGLDKEQTRFDFGRLSGVSCAVTVSVEKSKHGTKLVPRERRGDAIFGMSSQSDITNGLIHTGQIAKAMGSKTIGASDLHNLPQNATHAFKVYIALAKAGFNPGYFDENDNFVPRDIYGYVPPKQVLKKAIAAYENALTLANAGEEKFNENFEAAMKEMDYKDPSLELNAFTTLADEAKQIELFKKASTQQRADILLAKDADGKFLLPLAKQQTLIKSLDKSQTLKLFEHVKSNTADLPQGAQWLTDPVIFNSITTRTPDPYFPYLTPIQQETLFIANVEKKIGYCANPNLSAERRAAFAAGRIAPQPPVTELAGLYNARNLGRNENNKLYMLFRTLAEQGSPNKIAELYSRLISPPYKKDTNEIIGMLPIVMFTKEEAKNEITTGKRKVGTLPWEKPEQTELRGRAKFFWDPALTSEMRAELLSHKEWKDLPLWDTTLETAGRDVSAFEKAALLERLPGVGNNDDWKKYLQKHANLSATQIDEILHYKPSFETLNKCIGNHNLIIGSEFPLKDLLTNADPRLAQYAVRQSTLNILKSVLNTLTNTNDYVKIAALSNNLTTKQLNELIFALLKSANVQDKANAAWLFNNASTEQKMALLKDLDGSPNKQKVLLSLLSPIDKQTETIPILDVADIAAAPVNIHVEDNLAEDAKDAKDAKKYAQKALRKLRKTNGVDDPRVQLLTQFADNTPEYKTIVKSITAANIITNFSGPNSEKQQAALIDAVWSAETIPEQRRSTIGEIFDTLHGAPLKPEEEAKIRAKIGKILSHVKNDALLATAMDWTLAEPRASKPIMDAMGNDKIVKLITFHWHSGRNDDEKTTLVKTFLDPLFNIIQPNADYAGLGKFLLLLKPEIANDYFKNNIEFTDSVAKRAAILRGMITEVDDAITEESSDRIVSAFQQLPSKTAREKAHKQHVALDFSPKKYDHILISSLPEDDQEQLFVKPLITDLLVVPPQQPQQVQNQPQPLVGEGRTTAIKQLAQYINAKGLTNARSGDLFELIQVNVQNNAPQPPEVQQLRSDVFNAMKIQLLNNPELEGKLFAKLNREKQNEFLDANASTYDSTRLAGLLKITQDTDIARLRRILVPRPVLARIDLFMNLNSDQQKALLRAENDGSGNNLAAQIIANPATEPALGEAHKVAGRFSPKDVLDIFLDARMQKKDNFAAAKTQRSELVSELSENYRKAILKLSTTKTQEEQKYIQRVIDPLQGLLEGLGIPNYNPPEPVPAPAPRAPGQN